MDGPRVERPRDSALIVPVPEAEPAVGVWRERFDPSAASGIPAHVTVLFPFVPGERIDGSVIDGLAETLAAIPRFEAVFSRIERLPEVLWLRPRPDDGFRALTAAVWERWPEHPPYEGRFDDVLPHLTIAEGDTSVVPETVDATVAARLPIRCRVTGADLVRFAEDRWSTIAHFPLG